MKIQKDTKKRDYSDWKLSIGENGICFQVNHRRKLALIPALMILSGDSWTLQTGTCCRNTGLVPSSLDISCKSSLPSSCLWVIIIPISCLGRKTVRTARKMVFSPWNCSSLFSCFSLSVLPSFIKTPHDITSRTGTTARLECAAEGHPTPQIAWQKDGGTDFPAARERRMHVMPDDDVFFITDVKIEDMGVYSCTAQNSAGSVLANATLTVLGKMR